MARRSRRGGRRVAATGDAKPQRTDMNRPQPIQAANDPEVFGDQAAAMRSQQAIPLPQQAPSAVPGSFGALDRPSERPAEPLTEGMAMGPGRGPEVLPVGLGPDAVVDEIRGMFAANPSNELAEMLVRARFGQ